MALRVSRPQGRPGLMKILLVLLRVASNLPAYQAGTLLLFISMGLNSSLSSPALKQVCRGGKSVWTVLTVSVDRQWP